MLSNKTKVFALIPARGGSRGIPRKNLTLLAGLPLIEYTVQAAIKSKLIDDIWVSSDDPEILSISSNLGVKTVLRPSNLANDYASSIDVVSHFIESIPQNNNSEDWILIYLQPTSPLRDERHIDSALQVMETENADAVISVVEAEKPPQKSFTLDANGLLISLFDERLSNARRQDLPISYYPNGAIYAFKVSQFLSRGGFPSNGSFPFIMSNMDSIDIDNTFDLMRAEAAIGEKNGRI